MIVRRLDRLAAAAAFGAGALFALPAPAASLGSGVSPGRADFFVQAAYSPTVMATQRDLNALGYDAGPADGLIGARTRAAISAYERDNGLLVTGNATAQVAAHIEATLAKRSVAAARPEQNDRLGRNDRGGRDESGRFGRDDDRAGRRGGDRSMVADIQSELRQRGYPIAVVTGRMDRETEEAIQAYQRSAGLRQAARPSADLLASLKQDAAAPQRATRQEQVRAVQEALNTRGYNVGPPDGALGPSTRNAIRTYQSDARLPVTGAVDAALLAKLGLAAEAAAGSSAPQASFVTRISDDFSDGDYDRNPNWRVLAGEFTVRDGALQSTVTRREESPQDIGRTLLDNVLGQALGVRLPGVGEGAAIAQSTTVDNAFRVMVSLSGAAEAGALVNLGLFQGAEASSGYRLVYMADEQQPLRLVAASGQEATQISAVAPSVRLNDGRRHTLEWLRAADGRMTVRLDGAVVIDVIDNRFTGGFDGFSLINGGGAWRLDSAAVHSLAG